MDTAQNHAERAGLCENPPVFGCFANATGWLSCFLTALGNAALKALLARLPKPSSRGQRARILLERIIRDLDQRQRRLVQCGPQVLEQMDRTRLHILG